MLVGDRYRLDERIGFGGMAEVWRATDGRTGRAVAVKLLADGCGDARRFAAEVRALSRLSHPGVVRFLGAGDHHGRPYLVMDLVDGETLADRLRGGPVGPAEAARVGAGVAGALAAAHRLGIVHRDVKPGNVLLDRAGRPHLADFGVSRLAGSATITGSGSVVGTAGYLAPEQVEASPVGPPADVYALGLVLLECLTGAPAFPGDAVASAVARLARDPAVPGHLPAPWPALLAAMTARDPAHRPPAASVAAALGGATTAPHPVARAQATSVLPAVAAARDRHHAPVRRVVLAAVVAVLVALGLLVVAFVAVAGSGGDDPRLEQPATTVAPTTTAPPATTTPPTTAAPVPTTTSPTVPPTTATTAPPTAPPPRPDPGRGVDRGDRSGPGSGGGGGGRGGSGGGGGGGG